MVGVSGRGTPKGEAGNAPAAPATSATPPQAALKPDQADIPDVRTILVVVGVSGSGKTTIATALAQQLDWPFKKATTSIRRRTPPRYIPAIRSMTATGGPGSRRSQPGSTAGGRSARPA